jgi:hypothetical protein
MRATIGGDCDVLSKGFRNVTGDTANNSTAGGRTQEEGVRVTLLSIPAVAKAEMIE